jgi:hypothetical protein
MPLRHMARTITLKTGAQMKYGLFWLLSVPIPERIVLDFIFH